jgi:hypothetical protein
MINKAMQHAHSMSIHDKLETMYKGNYDIIIVYH